MGCEMYWLHSSLARKLRGSIPTRSTHLLDVNEHHAHVVQWLEHFPVKEEVAGSSPVVCAGSVAKWEGISLIRRHERVRSPPELLRCSGGSTT